MKKWACCDDHSTPILIWDDPMILRKRNSDRIKVAPPNRYLVVLCKPDEPAAIFPHIAQTIEQVKETIHPFLWQGPRNASGMAFCLHDGRMLGSTWERYTVEGETELDELGWDIEYVNGTPTFLTFRDASNYNTIVTPDRFANLGSTIPRCIIFMPIPGTQLRFNSTTADKPDDIPGMMETLQSEYYLAVDTQELRFMGKMPGDVFRHYFWG